MSGTGFGKTYPVSQLIRATHHRPVWSSIVEMTQFVLSWNTHSHDEVALQVTRAERSGLITKYTVASFSNPLLCLVITVNQADVASTAQFALDRLKESLPDHFSSFDGVYQDALTSDRIELIPGAKPFVPHQIKIEVVDMGTHWKPSPSKMTLVEAQNQQAHKLAGLQVLFAASQHPGWTARMDGEHVPFVLAGGLLVNPSHAQPWSASPRIWSFPKDGQKILDIDAAHIQFPYQATAIPLLTRL